MDHPVEAAAGKLACRVEAGAAFKKTLVATLVERGGRAIAKPTIDATPRTLTPIVSENIDKSAGLLVTVVALEASEPTLSALLATTHSEKARTDRGRNA